MSVDMESLQNEIAADLKGQMAKETDAITVDINRFQKAVMRELRIIRWTAFFIAVLAMAIYDKV